MFSQTQQRERKDSNKYNQKWRRNKTRSIAWQKRLKSVKIAPGAVVCVESEIWGDRTIRLRTVIHFKA